MRLFLYMSWHPKQLPEVAVLVTRSYRETLTRETERLLLRKQSRKGGFLLTRSLLCSAPTWQIFPTVPGQSEEPRSGQGPAPCRLSYKIGLLFSVLFLSALRLDRLVPPTNLRFHPWSCLARWFHCPHLCRCVLVSGCPEIRRWHLIPWN